MAGKAHNGSAEIAIRTRACLAGALACVLAALAFAATASATLPSVVGLAGAATQSGQSATGVVAPVSKAAAGAAGVAGGSAVPSAGATTAVSQSVKSTGGPPADAGRVNPQAADPASQAAGAVLPPVARAGVQTVEHTLARASGGIADVAASGESTGKALAPLVTVTSKAAGGVLAAAGRGSQGVESAVSGAGYALQGAARPVAAAVAAGSSPLASPTPALTVLPGRRPPGSADGAPARGRPAQSAMGGAPSPPRPALGVPPVPAGRAEAGAGVYAGLAELSSPASEALPGLEERTEGLGVPRFQLPSSLLLRPEPGVGVVANTSVRATHQFRAARASGRLMGPLGSGPVPTPGGVPASAAGAFGVAVAVLLALAGLLLLAVPRAIRRLRLSAAPWLGAAFVLIPERPG